MGKKGNGKRGGWNSEIGYIWAMVGSAVGFANILSFGAKAYKNGGGAFLIPLGVAILLLGVPMLILEGLIGKTYRAPLVSAFNDVGGSKGKFFAWTAVLGVITIGGFYVVINAWSLAYLWYSASGSIPADTDHFFHTNFLGLTSSFGEVGPFSWPIAALSLGLLAAVYRINARDIAGGIERLSKVFIPLLLALLCLFLVGVLFLPGSGAGMAQFIKPNFSLLWSGELWLTAFGHVFFSLSIGIAIISGYSAYTTEDINIVRSMCLVALGDFVTSFVSGLVIFGCLGHLAEITATPFAEVVSSSNFGLGFVVFPKLFQTFPAVISSIVGPLFFLSLFLAGVTGLTSIVEAVVGNFVSEFSLTRRRATLYVCCILATLAMGFSFGNAAYLIDTLDFMAAGVNVLLTGLAQILAFLYCTQKFCAKGEWFIGGRRAFYFYSLKYLSPVILLLILSNQVFSELTGPFDLAKQVRWGWFFLVAAASIFLARSAVKP